MLLHTRSHTLLFRLLQVVCGDICITTGPVFWALRPPSACWRSGSSSAKLAASWGEVNPPLFCRSLLLISHLRSLDLTRSPAQSRRAGPWCRYGQIKTISAFLFNLRYLSELCCVDGPLGAGQATFPVVSALLSANCNMSSIIAVFSLSDEVSALCHAALLRVLNCCPTCTMRPRITAATRTTRCCCRCWRAAANPTHGQWRCVLDT